MPDANVPNVPTAVSLSNAKVSFTMEDVSKIVATAVAESKKPTQEEADKKAKDTFYKARYRRQELIGALEGQMGEEHKQLNCPHRKEDDRYAVSGQITNDGFLTQVCQRCQSIWKSKPTPEMMTGDLNINGIQPLGKRVAIVADLKAAEAALATLRAENDVDNASAQRHVAV